MTRQQGATVILLIAVIALLVMILMLGAGAFYYYAVYLPNERVIADLQGQEADVIVEITQANRRNGVGTIIPMDREWYDSRVSHLEGIQFELKHRGCSTRPIPKFVPPKPVPVDD